MSVSTFTNAELAETIRAAVDVIEEQGWTVGEYRDKRTGNVCAVGALRIGAGCDVNDRGVYADGAPSGSDEQRRRFRVEYATNALETCLHNEQREAKMPIHQRQVGLMSFNDHVSSSKKKVTGLMTRCAERLEAAS